MGVVGGACTGRGACGCTSTRWGACRGRLGGGRGRRGAGRGSPRLGGRPCTGASLRGGRFVTSGPGPSPTFGDTPRHSWRGRHPDRSSADRTEKRWLSVTHRNSSSVCRVSETRRSRECRRAESVTMGEGERGGKDPWSRERPSPLLRPRLASHRCHQNVGCGWGSSLLNSPPPKDTQNCW